MIAGIYTGKSVWGLEIPRGGGMEVPYEKKKI